MPLVSSASHHQADDNQFPEEILPAPPSLEVTSQEGGPLQLDEVIVSVQASYPTLIKERLERSVADGVSYFGGNDILPAQFTYEDTGSTIVLGGMDRPSKVLSTEYDIIYINEATELTSEQWEQLGGRTDRPRLGPERPPSLLLGDCNPDAPQHWIKQRADEGKLRLWPTTHRDNPAMWDRITGTWTRSLSA